MPEEKTAAPSGTPTIGTVRIGADIPRAALDASLFSSLTRIGSDRIVTVEGVSGVFTPIGAGADVALTTDERKNLQAIIDRLKTEVGALQGENLHLAQQLTVLRSRPSAPDDFASGVQQSVNELAQRLAAMGNSMSNFAMREFKLDASVFVQVTPVGTIEYRFVQPGETIDAASLSKLSMTVVPVPKSNLAGVWSPELFQPDLPLGALPEATEEQVQRLESAGLYSIGEFLQVATRARAQAYLQALLGTERKRLALWAQQAALMTLRGVNGAAAMVLIEAGYGSFDALAGVTGETVARRYALSRKKLSSLGAPAAGALLASQWVRAARQYLGLPDTSPAGA